MKQERPLGWDADGMCDDHGRFACQKCAVPETTPARDGAVSVQGAREDVTQAGDGSDADLVATLERLIMLTPRRANASNAQDLHCSVRAIAESAIARHRLAHTARPDAGDEVERLRAENERLRTDLRHVQRNTATYRQAARVEADKANKRAAEATKRADNMAEANRVLLATFEQNLTAMPEGVDRGMAEREADRVLAEVETFLSRQGGFYAYAERARTGEATGWTRLRSVIWLAALAALSRKEPIR